MFTVLEAGQGDVLGVEISGAYTAEDVDAFKKAFEEVLGKGHAKVNILVRIDKMDLGGSHVGALFKDGMYALKNRDKMRHLAIVGNSRLEKILFELDNRILGDESKELIEKYFDAAEIEKAWEFVRA